MKIVGLDVLGADTLPTGWVAPDWDNPVHKMPGDANSPTRYISEAEYLKGLRERPYDPSTYDESDLSARSFSIKKPSSSPSSPSSSSNLPLTKTKSKGKYAAVASAGAHCGAMSASWQSAVALLVTLLLLVFLVQLMVTMINRGRQ